MKQFLMQHYSYIKLQFTNGNAKKGQFKVSRVLIGGLEHFETTKIL